MGIFPNDDANYRAVYAQESAMVDAAEAIAAALEASGITRTALAAALDVSKSEVTARLRGERNITVRTLAETLHALGATLSIEAKMSAGVAAVSGAAQDVPKAPYQRYRQAGAEEPLLLRRARASHGH